MSSNDETSNPERWQRVRELFNGAAALDPAARTVWLDEQCAGDAALREEVEQLLARDAGPALDIAGIVGDAAAEAGDASADVPRYERIGPYRIVRALGTGGMGSVWLAERADERFEQVVAIKVVSLRSPGLIERFDAERRILARLDHPYIARLFDGGETEDGLPYLVMEYVEGLPIGAYCDRERLNMTERLELFLKVCEAVQHAHRHLVIHRDIKPSNIVVDGQGRPKLLDFGIAKLLRADELAPGAPLTVQDLRAMTPEHASPEQVRGEPVTTATDVYSLGVLLYQLLSGHAPYRFTSRRPAEIERVICDSEPGRPSTVVTRAPEDEGEAGSGTPVETAEAISRNRRTTPAQLQKGLRGDLDNIVLMAMRKEPAARYSTVNALAEDIRRYLAREPVTANRGSWLYRGRKFIDRHRAPLAAAALMLAVVGGVIGWSTQRILRERDIAAEQRDTAEHVAQFMIDVFDVADPYAAAGQEVSARAVLDQALRRIDADESLSPRIRATLLRTMGVVYHKLGIDDEALRLLTEAVALEREHFGDAHEELALALESLASTKESLWETDAALVDIREAGRIMTGLHGAGSARTIDTRTGEALSLIRARRFDEALALLETLEQQARLLPEEGTEYANVLSLIGRAHLDNRDLEAARPYLERALELANARLASHELLVIVTKAMLSELYRLENRLADAEALQRELLASHERVLGPEHQIMGRSWNNLAQTLRVQAKYDEAANAQRRGLAILTAVIGPESFDVGVHHSNLGHILLDAGRYAEAREALEAGLAIKIATIGETQVSTGLTRQYLAETLLMLGRTAEAEAEIERALQVFAEADGEQSGRYAHAQSILGRVRLAHGRAAEAEALLRPSLATMLSGSTVPYRAGDIAVALGRALLALDRVDDARAAFEQALEIRETTLPEGHWSAAEARANLAVSLIRMGDVEQGASMLEAAVGALAAVRPADDPYLRSAQDTLAEYRAQRAATM